MEKLRYKTFVWPVNPEHYSEEVLREPVHEKNNYGDQIFQGLGPLKRVITGSGAFVGAGAYETFSQLAALMEQTDSGILAHPVWGERRAYFTGLQMTQQPRKNYVAYSFEFQAADQEDKIPK